jgi:hypothetical protein
MPVFDIKPDNKVVLNPKPSNKLVNRPTQVYTENRTFQAGQIMMSFPLITYPVAGTWNNVIRL